MDPYWLMLLAQESTKAKGGGGSNINPWWCALFAVALMVIWYFVFIRPKQKEQQEREEMLDALDKGDDIITIGGIKGRVTNIGDELITVRIDDNKNVKVKCKRWSVRDNLTKQEEDEEDTSDTGDDGDDAS